MCQIINLVRFVLLHWHLIWEDSDNNLEFYWFRFRWLFFAVYISKYKQFLPWYMSNVNVLMSYCRKKAHEQIHFAVTHNVIPVIFATFVEQFEVDLFINNVGLIPLVLLTSQWK